MKKLVIITGASSGIGKCLATQFSKKGHPTLLLSRSLAKMEDLNLPNSLCKSVDVTNLEKMREAIKEAEEKYGKVDLLISCAGLMLLGHPELQAFEEWSNMIDVNIKGILTGIHIVLADMKSRNEGTIINISSIAGRKTFDNHSIYCGTKFAVHAITENIRKEVADSNVRVIVIAPGVVDTPLLSHTTNEEIKDNYDEWKKTIESGLDPLQISNCIEFAYSQPQDVCIREIVIAKTKQLD
ncbi:SDR family oxidoreductase [Clostridium gasigenes]|uniref:SDR family oxidoreductase n=1 Tax=Clostridium gasigenes TaxID=94869 RepID=UPI001C0AF4DE|nr:SDR family oxidoreductase [Clostridium gasigenes]MBU3107808.1 SDR family oxidoreductase [Clostridium gasigenes]